MMKPFFTVAFIFFLNTFSLISQPSASQSSTQWKIDRIIQYQDRRLVDDSTFIRFCSDPDPLVRERAVQSFGSIQDTSVLGLLVDRFANDQNGHVRFAAAFAIGQTASQLSENGRKNLEHELIWNRLDSMRWTSVDGDSPKDHLIEEIGKFGTERGLNDLILKYGNTFPPRHSQALVMSIARFAIRTIISAEADKVLLRFVTLNEQTDWHVVYALQRVGDHPEIRNDLENIIPLYRNADPLVRMNLAALFGKLKNEKRCVDPLIHLAESDSDWRVRVNAIKALGNYDFQNYPGVIEFFRRLFDDKNQYVALTAVSTFGNCHFSNLTADTTLGQAVYRVEKIATNDENMYSWQLQSEAAIAIAKLEGVLAVSKIHLKKNPSRSLQMPLLNALGYTGSNEAVEPLLNVINGKEVVLARAALEGLQELAPKIVHDSIALEKIYEASMHALQSDDVALITTAASVLGDSLFLRQSSVPALVRALDNSLIPDDVEAIQEICSTLGKLKDNRAAESLRQELHQKDRSVVLAAASALKSITGKNYDDQVPHYFEPAHTDFDFDYLHALSDTVRIKIQTVRGEIMAELYKNYAPFTVMSFIKLARKGFYRGLTFHRIVPNFVIQGGDPRGDGWGGPGYSIRSEFSPLRYDVGTLGIASAGKDTEGSQFFITQSPQPHLDGRYTIFGKVVSGMDVVNSLQLDDTLQDVKIVP